MRAEFTAILRQGEEGYVALCAEVPGMEIEAATEQEALENLVDAIGIVFEQNREEALQEAGYGARRYRIVADLESSQLLHAHVEEAAISS